MIRTPRPPVPLGLLVPRVRAPGAPSARPLLVAAAALLAVRLLRR